MCTVCPWWLGYFLISPVRKWYDDPPERVLRYVREGMTVLEPGPGMGYFTLPLARQVGPRGRVIAVDIQPKMLASLQRRAAKSGLANRIATRIATRDSLHVADLAGQVDLTVACAMVHELPQPARFFEETACALKPGGRMLLIEPRGHVTSAAFDAGLNLASKAGLHVEERPTLKRSHGAVLVKR